METGAVEAHEDRQAGCYGPVMRTRIETNPFSNKTQVVGNPTHSHGYSLLMKYVVHADPVCQSADLDQIVLCEAQQIRSTKVGKGAQMAGQTVVVDPLGQVLR